MSKINLKILLLKKKQFRSIIVCVAIALIVSILSTYQPVVLQQIIDSFDLNNSRIEYRQLWFYFLLSFFILLINIFLTASQTSFVYTFKHKLRASLLRNLNTKDEIFFQKHSVGNINDILTKDIDEVSNFFSATFLPLLSDIVMVFTIIIILMVTHFIIGLIFIIYFLVSFFVIYRTQSKSSNIIDETRKLEMKNANNIEEVLFAKNEIILMNKKENMLDWLEEKYNFLWPYKKSRQKFIYKSWIISLCLVSISTIIALFLGGILFFNDYVQIGFVFLAFNFSQRIQQPLEKIQMHLVNWTKLKTSLANLNEIAGEGLEQGKFSDTVKSSLVLKNINFSYNNYQVLKDINMIFERKKITAISGKTGSGKTTLLKLIMKQLVDYQGNIMFNNKDYDNNYELQEINKKFLYLSGFDSFFKASLKDNLTLYSTSISNETFFCKVNHCSLLDVFPKLKNLSMDQWTQIPYMELNLSNSEIQALNLLKLLFLKTPIVKPSRTVKNE